MTAEQKRIEIARAIGCDDDLPDFFNDLNACHAAVQSQPIEFQRRFQDALNNRSKITGKLICQLTAADWSEEFLATI